MRRRTLLAMGAIAPLLARTAGARSTRSHVGSIKRRTWIWPTPERSKNHVALGEIRIGTAVELADSEPVSGNKWFAVKPFGYVFADDTTTFDTQDPWYRALASQAPAPGEPYPYRYAYSMGAPMYSRLPTQDEQRAAEQDLGPTRSFRHLGKWAESHEVLVERESGIEPSGPPPSFVRGHAPVAGSPWNPANPKVQHVPAGSGVAYARAFAAAGRTWLLTPDLLLVPADRVFSYRRTPFRGVTLGARTTLPLAWVRGESAMKLEQHGVQFEAASSRWPNKSHVPLTGTHVVKDRRRYWQTREQGGRSWILEDDGVSVVERETELRFGIGSGERWLHASITRGTMVAYDGLEPVWTTLWSGGKGGVPVPGNDPKKHATTEVGIFPLEWKDRVATMSPDPGAPTVFWFSDVPHIQYVHAPLALHVSYWHDRFGYLMSAECMNVSADDGRWLFDFTLPRVPDGWNSIRPHKLSGPSTKIRIVP